MSEQPAPEGFVRDGKHLVEAGLATSHPVYDEEGRVKGVIMMPYPLPDVPVSIEEEQAIRKAKRRSRRK